MNSTNRYYTDTEARELARQARNRGGLRGAGTTVILGSSCPDCAGKVRVTVHVGSLGQKKDLAGVQCDDCGRRCDVDWPL